MKKGRKKKQKTWMVGAIQRRHYLEEDYNPCSGELRVQRL